MVAEHTVIIAGEIRARAGGGLVVGRREGEGGLFQPCPLPLPSLRSLEGEVILRV